MLYEALLISAIVLVVVNLGFRFPRWALGIAGVCALFACLIPAIFYRPLIGSTWLGSKPVVQLQTMLLLSLVLLNSGPVLKSKPRWRPLTFLWLSTGATVALFAVFFLRAASEISEFSRLSEQYPFESMEARLPVPRSSKSFESLSAETKQELETQEKLTNDTTFRIIILRRIHEDHWRTFVDSDGFGELRRTRPTEDRLKIEPFPETPISQPEPDITRSISPEDPGTSPQEQDIPPFFSLHRSSLFDFVNRQGFGYVKDRGQVAGFQPHGFRSVPEEKGWKVQRVDLVGLLVHDEPVVYLTDGLPRMDRARKSPTRPLDTLEVLGLQEIEKGENLFVRQFSEEVRMIGALRSISECVKCHGGERGDLLGAFSYVLVKDGPWER